MNYVKVYSMNIGIIVSILESGAYKRYIEVNGNSVDRTKVDIPLNMMFRIIHDKRNKELNRLNENMEKFRNKLVHQSFDFLYLYPIAHSSNYSCESLTNYIMTIVEYIGYPITREEILEIWKFIYLVIDTCYEKLFKNNE